MDGGIKNVNYVKEFADDAKRFGKSGTNEDTNSVKADLKCLEDWSNLWQMQLNADKCKVVYFGNKNYSG